MGEVCGDELRLLFSEETSCTVSVSLCCGGCCKEKGGGEPAASGGLVAGVWVVTVSDAAERESACAGGNSSDSFS